MSQSIVLITGGTSGIGRATANVFIREGATVIVTGRKQRDDLAGEFIAADVSRRADVERLVRIVVEKYGRLDVAVNAAGSLETGAFKETVALDEDEFDGHIALNLKSVWLCMKYEIEAMLRNGRGSIVNVSSVNGLGGVPMNSLYAASKAGVLALTKSAALEYAARGIRINALVAGGFRTPMLEGVFAQMNPGDPESVAKMYGDMVPMQRVGNAEEAGTAIAWLASDAASYVTGSSIIVDGGLTAPYR